MSTKITEMVAKITGDTSGILSAFEKVKRGSQEIGRAATQSTSVAGKAFDVMTDKADKVAQSTGAILNAIYALDAKGSARVLALGNAVGQVAGLLGPQGKMVQGFAIVGSAITALFLQAREQAAETRRAIEQDLERLVNAGDFASITKKLQEIEQGTAGKNFDDGRSAIRQRIEALTQEANTVGKSARFYRERQAQIIEERKQLTALTKEYDKYNSALTSRRNAPRSAQATSAITVSADSNEAIAKRAEEAAAALARLREQTAALFDTLSGRTELQQAAENLLKWQKNALAAGQSAEEVRKQFDALFDDVFDRDARKNAEATRKLGGAIEDLNAPLTEQLSAMIKLKEARDDAAAAGARQLADAEAEIAALRQGAEAYDTFLRKQAQEAAVRSVIAKARAEGREATAQEQIDARTSAAYLYDAVKIAQQLQAALQNSGAGQLANELAAVAESATQIATSLGEAGRNIARVAAIASPLLKGLGSLQGALVRRGEDGKPIAGQSVGLLSALRGANGADSQAAALAGSLSIIGAVASVADALDLFGTRAAEKAREMQEAAREFEKGLLDFVAAANPKTGATAAIADARRQAEALAAQAAAAAGGRFDPTFFGGEVTATKLREAAALQRAAAAQIPRIASQLNTVADGFDKLAAGLEEVEKAAREQVLRNIEDLNVRKLSAAGRTEEANALRTRLDNEREIRAAEADRTDEGVRYLALLRDTIAAEEARAEIEARRASALSLLDDTLSILGGSKLDGLRATIATLSQLFPEFVGLFDDLDLASAGGLNGASERLRDLFRSLTGDGVITDAERPIVDAIRRALGSIESALGEIEDPLTAALAAFGVRVEVFGLTAAQQFGLLGDILRDAFPEIGTILDETASGDLASVKDALQARIAALLDGGITEAEQPLLAALQQLLGVVVGQIDDAAQEAEAAARAAEEARQQRVRDAERTLNAELSLGGTTGNEALQARARTLAGLSPVFADLLPQFSDTTANGIRASKDALFALFRQLQDGAIPIEEFGDLTQEEIIERILELNGNLDDLAGSLADAAKAAAEAAAAERQATQDLRIRLAKSRGDDTRLAEFEDAARRERDAAVAAGRSASFLAFLDQVLASERNKLLQDIAGEATSAAISAAVGASAEQAQGRNTVSRVLGGVTDVSVQVQNGYLRQIVDNTQATASYTSLLVSLLSGSRSTIPVPSIPSLSSGGGLGTTTIVINLGAPVINTPMVGAPADVGRQIGIAQGLAVQEALGRLLELDARALGGRIR